LLILPLEQVPEMARSGRVILQRYRYGGMADVNVFGRADGLARRLGDKTRTESNPARLDRSTATERFPRAGKFGE
jgi:topoisomerase-4 subunit A